MQSNGLVKEPVNVRDQFDLVRRIGRLDPDQALITPVVRSIDSGECSVEDLFAALCASSVTTFAIASLQAVPVGAGAGALLGMLKKYEEEDRAWGDQVIGVMRRVVVKAAEEGGHVIKGLANQSLYPVPQSRHMGDVDLHFPTCDAALGIIKWLRDEGWDWDTSEFPWLKWHESGMTYGQLSLILPGSAEPPARVDLHFGPFSIGHAELMPLAGWRPGSALEVPASTPSPESAIALTAAHALNDQMISMKDVNDLHCLTGPDIDWPTTTELCRGAGAEPVLGRYLVELARAYPDDRPPSLPGAAALGHRKPAPLPRARAFARHAYRGAISRGQRRPAAVRLASDAFRYYRADLAPRASSSPVPLPIPRWRLRHRCWRLLPQQSWAGLAREPMTGQPTREERLAGEMSLILADNAAVVLVGNDVFVPTLWGDVGPRSTGLAYRLAGDRS